jgi:hypothetical protein
MNCLAGGLFKIAANVSHIAEGGNFGAENLNLKQNV